MIDLHVHSAASDGTMKPDELVKYASEKNLHAIALTDHDTISGLKDALAAAGECGIRVIPGIEMSCLYHGTEIHILGYFINPADASFLDDMEFFRKSRDERNEIVLDNLAEDGILLSRQELTFGNPDAVITRAHFARLLTEKGYTRSMAEAFKKYLTYGGKYCPRKKGITPEHVMSLFRKHNIWASLAHPYQYGFSRSELEDLIRDLRNLGLRGLEAWHSSHHLSETDRLLSLTRVFELIPTGGTDFHGSNKPDIDIGTGLGGMNIPDSVLEKVEEDYKAMTGSL